MISAKFIQVTTSTDGDEHVPFPSMPAHEVEVFNATGTDLAFQRVVDEDETTFILPAGVAFNFQGLTNANQLRVKRADEGNEPVTLASVEVRL